MSAVLGLCLMIGADLSRVLAQGPGTLPPRGLLQNAEPWPEQLEGIRPHAFLFQDESDTPVVMPRMSFEEIDRLRKLDRGVRSGDRLATLERLSIDGSTESLRAQWNVEILVRLEPAAVREMTAKSIVVNLGLTGAHLLKAADIRITTADAAELAASAADEQAGELPGHAVPGAYVRLPQSNRLHDLESGQMTPLPVTDERAGGATGVGPVGSTASNLPALPQGFPAFLQPAIGGTAVDWGESDGGYQLVIPVESVLEASASPRKPPLVLVKMEMSSRVWAPLPRQFWLPFQLPTVSTSLRMDLHAAATADMPAAADSPTASPTGTINSLNVIGSGREVVRREENSNRFVIQCDGGVMALNWVTTTASSVDEGDLVEVESETQVQWESPTEPPSMDIRLLAKNLRGPLRGCEIRLPPDAVLTSPPEVIAVNEEPRGSEDPDPGSDNLNASRWEISVSRSSEVDDAPPETTAPETTAGAADDPAAERATEGNAASAPTTRVFVRWAGNAETPPSSQVQVRLQLRQVTAEATAATPWIIKVPQVSGAIGHRGQVTIRTAGDHRLRWRPRLGIDAIASQQSSDQNADLVYPFRFTQTRFELPVWLSGKQQQVRLTVESELQVTRRAARVELDLQASGLGIDPKGLRLELGKWRLLGITSESRGSELEVNESDEFVEWQVDTSDGKRPEKYKITAELLASASSDNFSSLVLPRLISSDPATTLSDVQLSVLDGRRESWLINLAESPALQRIAGQSDSRFRILSPESPWSLNGSFASLPLQIQWSADVSMSQSTDHWTTRSTWSVTSPLDLEGRLEFAIPTPGRKATKDQRSAGTKRSDSPAPKSEDQTPLPARQLQGSELADADSRSQSTNEATSGDSSAMTSAGKKPRTVEPAGNGGEADVLTGQWTALVDGSPAIVRDLGPTSGSDFANSRNYEIVSPRLDSGTHHIELVFEQPILLSTAASPPPPNGDAEVPRGEITSLLRLPVPVADQVEMSSPLRLEMPEGATDSAGMFWRVVPDMDGVLGNLHDASRFEWTVVDAAPPASSGQQSRPAYQWTFKVVPDFPIPVLLRSRFGEEKLTEIPRSFLRSLIGKQFRHEHLMASVRGGRRVRLGLPSNLQTIRVEVRLDGKQVASTRDAMGLRIDLPDVSDTAPQARFAPSTTSDTSAGTTGNSALAGGSAFTSDLRHSDSVTHLLDVRLWTEDTNNPWWSRSAPLIRLPVGSGLQYWQLVVPTDSHLFWASSQSGRAMRWQRDQLRMSRVPAVSDTALIRWALDLDWQFGDSTAAQLSPQDADSETAAEREAGARSGTGADGQTSSLEAGSRSNESAQEAVLREAIRESLANSTFTVPGNRYLFFAGNVLSFGALTVSQTVLWLAVGGLVLLLASAFQWFPSLNHPLIAFVLAIVIAGLWVIAPDGVILTAQLVLISLTLVAVFYAISAVTVPTGNQRALPPRGSSRDSSLSRAGSQRANSDLAPQARLRRPEPSGGQSVTEDFDPRYTPTGSHSQASAVPTAAPQPDTPTLPSANPLGSPAASTDEDSTSKSGVFDASDPDSSEAVP